MNVLFITLGDIQSADQRGIYTDLMRQFAAGGHEVYIASPTERRNGVSTQMLPDSTDTVNSHIHILKVRTGNIQKTNMIEKGISTILLEWQMRMAIGKYLRNIKFDLVLYSTPPITLCAPIAYIKKRDNAKTYLMLKDIFPQNALDIGVLKKTGLKGLLYRNFRNKEKKLYALSDMIGCMSQANVDYVLRHNPEIDTAKVEVCPNTIAAQDMSISADVRAELREKYGIPQDRKVFAYGGNLGRPQGIPFLIRCLEAEKNNKDVYFFVVGDGTEYKKLEAWIEMEKPENVQLQQKLPREDYDRMVAACDVGMIFLDHRFTIPNFPSRLLSYLQAKLPVLCCTDPNTDIGKVCVEGGFGWWCESDDAAAFAKTVDSALAVDLTAMGESGFQYLNEHYTAEKAYEIIMKHHS